MSGRRSSVARMSALATREPRPRTKPQELRRDELLASGERLFLAQGVAATSIDDVAAGADVAKGTFYLYFDSKEDMLAALRERFAERHRAAIAARVASERADDWRARLGAWVEGSVTFYLDQVALHDALFHAHDHHPRRRNSRSENRVVAALAELLAEGMEAGAWSIDDPAMASVLLFNALHGAVDHAIARGEQGSRARLVRAVQAHFLRVAEPNHSLSVPRGRRRSG
ncbi:MAG TPA: TetR/AcrR family transcriptional regulator [Stellaceae bacterium]|nr:TetR/AcrR family transcriptional regulator [Stellaceae bacterium]